MDLSNGSFLAISAKVGKDYKQAVHSQISTGFFIVLVTIWMFTCNFTFGICLRRVHLEITQHSNQVESLLGPRRVQIEINLYKIAKATIVLYSIFWIPYGVTGGLSSAYGMSNSPIACAYFFGAQLSYAPFGILPYIYIMSDKKARKQFFKVCAMMPCKGQKIQPSAEESPPQQ